MRILSALLEISVYSAVIILFIVIIKKVLGKRITAVVQFSLWVLLILRLLIPFSLESGLHLVKISAPIEPPTANAVVEESLPNDYQNEYNFSYTPAADSSTTDNNIESTSEQQPLTGLAQQETSKQQIHYKPTLSDILIAVWLVGAFAMLVFMALTYIWLRRRIQNSAITLVPENVQKLIKECKLRMNVRRPVDVLISSEFESTMLLAALRPKLIIPVAMIEDQNDEVLKHCLLHEFAHCKRRDYLWYLLINVLCAVYWFNPAVWLGIRLMKQDMEAACDAHVVRTMTNGERNSYAGTLLSMFTNQTKRFQIAMGMGVAAKKEAAKRLRGIYMRRKMKLRTKLTVAMLILLVLFTCFTTACQPGETVPDTSEAIKQNNSVQNETDNEEPSVNTEENENIILTSSTTQLSIETSTEPYAVPEHWMETVQEDTLTVEIDTDITMPATDKFPVARVEPLTLTQELVNELVEYFVPDGKLYEWPRPRTKADYEEQIEEARKGQYVDGEYVVTSSSLAWVAELERRIENAPEEASVVYVDPTLTYRIGDPNQPRDMAGGKNFLSVKVERDGQVDPRIYVANLVEGYRDRVRFCYSEGNWFMTESYICGRIEECMRYEDDDPEDQTLEQFTNWKAVADGITLTLEEAQPYAEKVLSDLGLMDLKLITAEKATLINPYNDGSDDVTGEDIGGYGFVYMREINGMVGFERDSWGGNPMEEAPAYVEPFEQETVKIFVSEKGVQHFEWNGSARVTEEITDSVKLLSFSQVQQALVKQIYNKNIAPLSAGLNLRVKVVSAELCMDYINTDKEMEALFVPVWKFDVYRLNAVDNYELTEASHSIVVINAIDGGTIDRYSPE